MILEEISLCQWKCDGCGEFNGRQGQVEVQKQYRNGNLGLSHSTSWLPVVGGQWCGARLCCVPP